MDTPEATAPAEQSPLVEDQQPVEAPQEAPQEAEAPKADDKPRTRRESIQRALDSLNEKPAEKAESKPAEDGERPRGPDGKFVAKEGEAPKEEAPKAEARPEDAPKSPIGDAPQRFSADAKAAWKDVPDAVRGEIHRAIRENENGLREKDELLGGFKPYFDMARQQGMRPQDVPQVLGRYVQMENALRQDPRRGIEAIANNMGLTLDQFMAKVQGQQPGQADAKDQQILELRREIQNLQGQFGQVSQTVQQQREQAVMNDVTRFAQEHPRFDELAGEIARLIQTGYASDLSDAYEKAERLNPAPQPAPQPAQPPAPAQTRQPRSVTGAPGGGSNPRPAPSANRREAIERGLRAAGL